MQKKISIIEQADQPDQFQQRPIYYHKNVNKEKIQSDIKKMGHQVDSFIQKMCHQNQNMLQGWYSSKTTPLKPTGNYAYNQIKRSHNKDEYFLPSSTNISIGSTFMNSIQSQLLSNKMNTNQAQQDLSEQQKNKSSFNIKVKNTNNKSMASGDLVKSNQKGYQRQTKKYLQNSYKNKQNRISFNSQCQNQNGEQYQYLSKGCQNNQNLMRQDFPKFTKKESFEKSFDQAQTVCNFNGKTKNASLNLKRRRFSTVQKSNKKVSKQSILMNHIKNLQKQVKQLKQRQNSKQKRYQKANQSLNLFGMLRKDFISTKEPTKYQSLNKKKQPYPFIKCPQNLTNKKVFYKSHDKRINLSQWTEDLNF